MLVRLVVTIHDFAAYEFPGMQGWRRGAQLRSQLRRAAGLANRIVVPSESVRRELMQRFPLHAPRTRVIQHGVAAVFHRSRSAPAIPTFVTIATLERRKNLTTLIDAFAHVVAHFPEARLRIIGQPANDAAAIRDLVTPLAYWLFAGVFSVLGETAIAARLPAVVFFLFLLSAAQLSRRGVSIGQDGVYPLRFCSALSARDLYSSMPLV